MSRDKISQIPLGSMIRQSRLCLYKKTTDQRGSSIVEFAIFVLLFIMLLFGIIDFGLLLFNQQVVTNAAREGARYGIVARPDDYKVESSSVIARVQQYAQNHIVFPLEDDPTERVRVDVQFISGLPHCEKFHDVLKVDVIYDYYFLFLPFAKKRLEAQTVMLCE